MKETTQDTLLKLAEKHSRVRAISTVVLAINEQRCKAQLAMGNLTSSVTVIERQMSSDYPTISFR